MTVKVHSGLCMKYSRWDIYLYILLRVSVECWDLDPAVSAF